MITRVLSLGLLVVLWAGCGTSSQPSAGAPGDTDTVTGTDTVADTVTDTVADTVTTSGCDGYHSLQDASQGSACTDTVTDTDTVTVTDTTSGCDGYHTLQDASQGSACTDTDTDTVTDTVTDTDTDAVTDTVTDSGKVDAGDPNGCTVDSPCKGGKMCILPGQSIGCGMCQKPPNACQTDAECASPGGKPKICLYKKSDCTCSGEKLCHDGCTVDGDCAGDWEVCGGTNHCETKPCNATADCPALFTCDAGACKRLSCKSGAECAGGHCVNWQCHPKKGFCSYPPP